jgi:uncharacterized RDD family membrane protein YckC
MKQTIDKIRLKKIKTKSEVDPEGNIVEKEFVTLELRVPKLVKPTTRLIYGLIDLSFILVINSILLLITSLFIDQLIPDFMAAGNILIGVECAVFTFIYYAFSESVFGTTLGKHFFGYTVINRFAERVSTDEVLTRSIVRFIPLDPFSFLDKEVWHDSLSKTYVVHRSEKAELQRLFGIKSKNRVDILD